jgi:hypothetical protein
VHDMNSFLYKINFSPSFHINLFRTVVSLLHLLIVPQFFISLVLLNFLFALVTSRCVCCSLTWPQNISFPGILWVKLPLCPCVKFVQMILDCTDKDVLPLWGLTVYPSTLLCQILLEGLLSYGFRVRLFVVCSLYRNLPFHTVWYW